MSVTGNSKLASMPAGGAVAVAAGAGSAAPAGGAAPAAGECVCSVLKQDGGGINLS